jgi:hypothetical protein
MCVCMFILVFCYFFVFAAMRAYGRFDDTGLYVWMYVSIYIHIYTRYYVC